MDLSLLSYGANVEAATNMEPPPQQPPHSPPPESHDLKTPHLFRNAVDPEAEEADPVVMDPKGAEAGVKYRECMRNHAASIGGHASDGCGEFMPGGGGTKEGSLSCAACGCHRSFHRRELFGGDGRDRVQHNRRRHRVVHSPPPSSMLLYTPGPTSARWDQKLVLPQHVSAPAPLQAHVSTSPPHHHHQHHHNRHAIQQQQRHNSMSGMISAIDLRDDQPEDRRSETPEREEVGSELRRSNGNSNSSSSKRFRTKFTAEQKEKMTEYAERTGWRIQRQDDGALSEFCAAVGVKRNVLKVWMHNNKAAALRRREPPAPPYPSAAAPAPVPLSAAVTPPPPPPAQHH